MSLLERGGYMVIIGLILVIMLILLFWTVHVRTKSLAGEQIATVANMVFAPGAAAGARFTRRDRKGFARKGFIHHDLLLIVVLSTIVFLVSFMLWGVVDEEGQKAFVSSIGNIGGVLFG